MSNVTNPAALSPSDLVAAAIAPGPSPTPFVSASSTASASFPTITYYPRDQSGELVIPSSAHSLDGFRQWAQSNEFENNGRISFLQGRLVVDMSPESFEEHAFVKREICRVLLNRVHDRKLGQFLLDGVLYTNVSAEVSNEPDALFVRHESLRSGKVELLPQKLRPQSSKEICGSVDWVLEIVSPSSVVKDTQWLREAYYRAGVGEYWLVDAIGDEIDFQILVPAEEGYVSQTLKEGWLSSSAFGADFHLTREPDVNGYWQYTLDIKESEERS